MVLQTVRGSRLAFCACFAAALACTTLAGRARAEDVVIPEKPADAPLKPGSFEGRLSAATRAKLLKEGGGSDESEAAVARGLLWLALHQAPDGHWSLNEFQKFAHKEPRPDSPVFTDACGGAVGRMDDIAATAFGLLPFLGAGYVHESSTGRKIDDPKYGKTVKAGLHYLIDKQALDGSFGRGSYTHALATIALCEAYGMTGDRTLKPSAQDAVDYIVSAQDPSGGGWRYSPQTAGDLSVTGWMLTALETARLVGLDVPKKALKKGQDFVDSCETTTHGYSYMPKSGQTPVMTAVGMLCRQRFGADKRDPGLLRGVDYLKKEAGPGKTGNIYYEYYATQVMYNMGGDAWDFWNKGPTGNGKGGVRDSLIAKQDKLADLDPKKACQEGSWGPDGGALNDGGRMMYTSLSLLTLEVYYRHVPLYRKDNPPAKDKD